MQNFNSIDVHTNPLCGLANENENGNATLPAIRRSSECLLYPSTHFILHHSMLSGTRSKHAIWCKPVATSWPAVAYTCKQHPVHTSVTTTSNHMHSSHVPLDNDELMFTHLTEIQCIPREHPKRSSLHHSSDLRQCSCHLSLASVSNKRLEVYPLSHSAAAP